MPFETTQIHMIGQSLGMKIPLFSLVYHPGMHFWDSWGKGNLLGQWFDKKKIVLPRYRSVVENITKVTRFKENALYTSLVEGGSWLCYILCNATE